MGCSTAPRETFVAAPQLSEIKPARPAPITLTNVRYQRCGKMACLPLPAARRELDNKVEIYSWMTGANAVMDYYEGRPAPAVGPVTAPLVIAPVKNHRYNLFSRSKK